LKISERKQLEKERRKKAILDTAERLFFARQYDAVSMDEIANEVELSKPTLYLHFKDKESLFLAIVERGLRTWLDMTRAAVKDADSGIDQLAVIGITHHRFVRAYPEYDRVLAYFRSGRFDAMAVTGNEAYEAVDRILQESGKLNDTAIRTGIGDGTLRSDIDPDVLSILLSTFSVSVNNLSPLAKRKLQAREIDEDRFFNEFFNMMTNMIENPDHKVPRRIQVKKVRRKQSS
jgi:AcrR family transcriptional regulator